MGDLLRGLGRFLLGAAIGAAAGAAAGTLYAPSRGNELKQRLLDRLEAARRAGDQAEESTVQQLRRQYNRYLQRS